MSESLRRAGIEAEDAYRALLKVVRERIREDKESREIHAFVKSLTEDECKAFVEDALQHFRESDDAKEYGNIMARTLHMYGYEIYGKLSKWQS